MYHPQSEGSVFCYQYGDLSALYFSFAVYFPLPADGYRQDCRGVFFFDVYVHVLPRSALHEISYVFFSCGFSFNHIHNGNSIVIFLVAQSIRNKFSIKAQI
ncbi:hypothetical protein PROPEN_01425 [Proteus penneri ATCC 35198]|nr:hypothetical protein PROPEN_01425 [Proteus penneri ATCC 35198]